jgi:hypothetical protein
LPGPLESVEESFHPRDFGIVVCRDFEEPLERLLGFSGCSTPTYAVPRLIKKRDSPGASETARASDATMSPAAKVGGSRAAARRAVASRTRNQAPFRTDRWAAVRKDRTSPTVYCVGRRI